MKYGSSPEDIDGSAYVGPIEGGKISGEMPVYIKKFDSDEFLSVTSLYGTFFNLTELEESPKIPDAITDMDSTFYGCTGLNQAPEIPYSVTNLKYTFYGCKSLTGNLVINANIPNRNWSSYSYCLTDVAINDECNLILSGNSLALEDIYNTKSDNSNITLNK